MNNVCSENKAYVIENPAWDQAVREAREAENEGYMYALVQRFSELFICSAKDLQQYLDENECVEIRIFGEDKELHLIYGDEKCAIRVTDRLSENSSEDKVLIRKYLINSNFLKEDLREHKKLVVKQYLDVDQDGQVYIALTRLQDIQ